MANRPNIFTFTLIGLTTFIGIGIIVPNLGWFILKLIRDHATWNTVAVVGSCAFTFAMMIWHRMIHDEEERKRSKIRNQAHLARKEHWDAIHLTARREKERNFKEAVRLAEAHFTSVRERDQRQRSRLFDSVTSSYRAWIKLSESDRSGARHPFVEWKGAPGVRGEVHIFRDQMGGLYRSIKEVDSRVGSRGRIAVKPLHRDGSFRHFATRPGSTSAFYVYWTVEYSGERPAISVQGRIKETYTAADLKEPHFLTKIPYTNHIKGGLRSVELTTPGRAQPLWREEQELLHAEQRAAFSKRWEALGKGKKTVLTDPGEIVEAAVEAALREARREDALDKAFEEQVGVIANDNSLSDDAKEHAIRILEERLLATGSDEWDD